ncbi:hypothetical protein [Spirosoma fluviale]|uniref:Uncharacterized protein n=1 Tax=Spirosoma fluviale TaxID=1597977 RepID=A0A286FD74_9BACT|nr:hypothetical protein [Spirosoma fluviale]SOD80929.1 hypothetical protein SAMN06269250_1614 [Spirosoma fluviale]
MPRPYAIGSDALIAGLMAPTTNWGQLMAAKDQQLQQQTYATQLSEQELLEEQQAAAQIAAFKQKIRSLPLERPDKVRVSKWLKGQESANAERLAKEYQGNLSQFMAAEGPAWMEQTLGALEQSDEYTTGVHNLEQITLAKEAMRKGENLIGQVVTENGKQRYIPATNQLQEYYKGRLPKFDFNGSYKDDDSLLKHFGEKYPTGVLPYEKVAVTEDDKLNYLMSTDKPEVAMDKYLRKYQNTKVYYKTKSLDEYQDYINKQQDQRMQVEDHRTKRTLDGLRIQGAQLGNELKRAKISKLSESGDGADGSGAYLRRMIPQSQTQPGTTYDPSGNKVLRHAGYDLNAFGGKATGKVSFNALDILDKQSADALGNLLGAEKVPVSKTNPTGWRGGKVLEGIVAKNGFNAVDLAGTKHEIVHVDPRIYTNPREFNQNGAPISSNGPMGFVKVKVKFADNSEAKKAGLVEGMFSSATRMGAGAYDKDSREVEIYTPIGNIYKNAALNRYLSNQDAGTKVTNDFMNPYALGIDDDE